jgi:hypothetical protein
LAPYAEKYDTRYGSDGHNEHADFVEKNLAIPGLRRTLVDHLEHGDLLQSRPLPRAWRLTNGNYAGRKISANEKIGAFRIACRSSERRHHFRPIQRRNRYFSCVYSNLSFGNVNWNYLQAQQSRVGGKNLGRSLFELLTCLGHERADQNTERGRRIGLSRNGVFFPSHPTG